MFLGSVSVYSKPGSYGKVANKTHVNASASSQHHKPSHWSHSWVHAGFPCRANVAHVRQSRPDSGRGFQAKVVETVNAVPSSLGSGGYGLGMEYLG